MSRFWLFKSIGGPGSMGFLVFGTAVALLLVLFRRTRRIGRLGLIGLFACYTILSIPAVAQVIAGAATAIQAEPADTYGHLDEIFVIDGDNYRARAALAVKLTAATSPRVVWIVGGGELQNALIEYGVPEELWRWGPGGASTTHDQMLRIRGSMLKTGGRRVAVVASRLQVPRVIGVARRLGLDVLVIPSPMDHEPAASGLGRWLPSFSGLRLSHDGLYERMALAYYRWNGWL